MSAHAITLYRPGFPNRRFPRGAVALEGPKRLDGPVDTSQGLLVSNYGLYSSENECQRARSGYLTKLWGSDSPAYL